MKLSAFVDLDHQLIISQKIRRCPAHDSPDFEPTVRKGKNVLDKLGKKAKSFDADKGYDKEDHHRLVVEELQAEDRIRVKNKDVPIHRTKEEYRKKVKRRIKKLRANYRSKNETIFSVLKRIQGSSIRSIKIGTQNKEMVFKEIAYNARRFITNLLSVKHFYRALKKMGIVIQEDSILFEYQILLNQLKDLYIDVLQTYRNDLPQGFPVTDYKASPF